MEVFFIPLPLGLMGFCLSHSFFIFATWWGRVFTMQPFASLSFFSVDEPLQKLLVLLSNFFYDLCEVLHPSFEIRPTNFLPSLIGLIVVCCIVPLDIPSRIHGSSLYHAPLVKMSHFNHVLIDDANWWCPNLTLGINQMGARLPTILYACDDKDKNSTNQSHSNDQVRDFGERKTVCDYEGVLCIPFIIATSLLYTFQSRHCSRISALTLPC